MEHARGDWFRNPKAVLKPGHPCYQVFISSPVEQKTGEGMVRVISILGNISSLSDAMQWTVNMDCMEVASLWWTGQCSPFSKGSFFNVNIYVWVWLFFTLKHFSSLFVNRSIDAASPAFTFPCMCDRWNTAMVPWHRTHLPPLPLAALCLPTALSTPHGVSWRELGKCSQDIAKSPLSPCDLAASLTLSHTT